MRIGEFVRSIGPAIIVAAVVCGPGSILTASKTGANYGFGMVWVLGLAVVLMVGATALAAYIGTVSKGTVLFCQRTEKKLKNVFTNNHKYTIK